MVQNKHLWQPEAQLPEDKPSEELATQLSKLMDHNQQLALQLAEMVAKTSRELEQNQKSMVQLSDILARTMQHNQHLATQLSEVTGHLKRQRRFLTPLPVLHFGDDEESWVRDGENWKSMVQLSLARDNMYRHVQEDIPEPKTEAEREKWTTDRQNIVELMVASIRNTNMLERIRCLGWSPKHTGPKSTYQLNLDALSRRYQQEMYLVQGFRTLETSEDASWAEAYFENLDTLYGNVIRNCEFRDSYTTRLSYFLQGIRGYYPELYDCHASKIANKSFSWRSFFGDIAYDAMLGRFRDYPAEIRRMEQAYGHLYHRKHREWKSLMLEGRLHTMLGAEVGKAFLDRKGIAEVWESLMKDAAMEGR